MKHILVLFILMINLGYGQKGKEQKSVLVIPAKQVVQVNYPNYKGFMVKMWNKSKYDLGVSAREQDTDSLKKGFGLTKGANASLSIPQHMYLQFENRFLAPIKVEYIVYKGKPAKKTPGSLTAQRGFYLVNSTAQKIPLRIPGIMNPNLSPFSKSGVDLPLGQEIYLNVKGKDLLIFTVTDTIPKGAKIEVADLIDRALNK